MEPKNLKSRFLSLWQSLILHELNGECVFQQLVHLYNNPPRGYHNLENHICHCLTVLDEVKPFAKDPLVLEYAIWFHDAIYDTKIQGIEELCANLAYKIGKNNGLSDVFCHKASLLILATRHIDTPNDPDERLLCDIDLSPLGLPAKDFDQNASFIRKEYGWVKDADFAKGRIRILKKYLDRQNLYLNQYFRDRFEAQARQNLIRSIAQLSTIIDK